MFFCYHVSVQNASGPGGSEISGRRQWRQEIRGRRDGGNLVLGDRAVFTYILILVQNLTHLDRSAFKQAL